MRPLLSTLDRVDGQLQHPLRFDPLVAWSLLSTWLYMDVRDQGWVRFQPACRTASIEHHGHHPGSRAVLVGFNPLVVRPLLSTRKRRHVPAGRTAQVSTRLSHGLY